MTPVGSGIPGHIKLFHIRKVGGVAVGAVAIYRTVGHLPDAP